MRFFTFTFSIILSANFAYSQDLPLPQQGAMPLFQGSGRPLEKPNAVIRPPSVGPIVVPQVTQQEKQDQIIAEKERQIVDQMLRRRIAVAHATGKAGEIKRVILMNGPSDALLSMAPTAPAGSSADRLELIGLEPNAVVSKQLDGFFGSPMTPESEQRLLETVRTQLTASNGKGMPNVRLAGWWPEEGVIAVSVVTSPGPAAQ